MYSPTPTKSAINLQLPLGLYIRGAVVHAIYNNLKNWVQTLQDLLSFWYCICIFMTIKCMYMYLSIFQFHVLYFSTNIKLLKELQPQSYSTETYT